MINYNIIRLDCVYKNLKTKMVGNLNTGILQKFTSITFIIIIE